MKTKRSIERGYATNNGIVFYSQGFPIICSETYRDDLGKINEDYSFSCSNESCPE